VFDDIRADLKEHPLVLDWDQCAFRAVVHCEPKWFYQGPGSLDVALNAHVPEHHEGLLCRRAPDRRTHGNNQSRPDFELDSVVQEVDDFDVEVRGVQLPGPSELALVGLDVCESPLNRLLRRTRYAAGTAVWPARRAARIEPAAALREI
jgi:hypothetical protein